MVRPTSTSFPHLTRRLTVTVRVGRADFAFDLYARPIALGPGREIDYYWMDSTGFRITHPRRAGDHGNVRNCLGHWWATMTAAGVHHDPHQIDHMLLASSYAVVSGSKATHQVFRDAHVEWNPGMATTEVTAGDVNARIRASVGLRDRAAVGRELDAIFDAPTPLPDAECKAMWQTFEGLLARGRDLVRASGIEGGCRQFMSQVDVWSEAKRKKGDLGWLRPFLNRFAYRCKAAFYTCYANAWDDLIPALRRDHGLDVVGERFLRVWHRQNPPVLADAFRGQVLALHPLSAFVMKDPTLLAVAGQFFGTDAHARGVEHDDTGVPEYWDLVGAILTAGHRYRQAADRRAARRRRATPAAARRALEAYAAARNLRCPTCGGSLHVTRLENAEPGSIAQVAFECGLCRHEVPVVIEKGDFGV